MCRLRKRGVLFVEYALILAFVVCIGVFFTSSDSIKGPIKTIFNRASAMLQGKHYIATAKDFWDAVKDNDTYITFDKSNDPVPGIIAYLLYDKDYQFVSGAADVNHASTANIRPTVEGLNDGKPFNSAPKGLEAILEQAGYTGIENVSWSVLKDGNKKYLYVADKRYTNEDPAKVGTIQITRYDLENTSDPGQTMAGHLEQSKNGYVYIKPGK